MFKKVFYFLLSFKRIVRLHFDETWRRNDARFRKIYPVFYEAIKVATSDPTSSVIVEKTVKEI